MGSIHSLVFNRDQLLEHARELAHQHEVLAPSKQHFGDIQNHLKNNSQNFKAVHKTFSLGLKDDRPLLPSSTEWFLDNYFIVRDQINSIKYDLTPNFYKRLSRLSSGTLKDYPRIYSLSLEILSHTDNRLDRDLLVQFITAYESISPLSSAELWALPIMLRLVLINHLNNLMVEAEITYQKSRSAKKWAEKFISSPVNPERLLTADLDDTFLLWLMRSLKDGESMVTPIIKWLELYIEQEDINLEEIVRSENQIQAGSRVTTGNIITSLRLLSSLDWQTFFESTSLVEKILQTDPAGVYSQMDFKSRDLYRHAVEDLSNFTKLNEQEIARRAIKMSSKNQLHVGYFLIGAGHNELKTDIHHKPSFRYQLLQLLIRYPSQFYVSAVAIGVSVGLYYLNWNLVAIIPLSAPVVTLLNFLLTHFYPPWEIPKLEYKNGITKEASTAIIVPCLLGSINDAHVLTASLEKRYLANHDDNLIFALLTDFSDAPTQKTDQDSQLILEISNLIIDLNHKHAPNKVDIFYLLHRHRLYNSRELLWMGWERKRGKLLEFVQLLKGSKSTSFSTIIGDQQRFSNIKYIITLDADTQMPMNSAKKLIGAISHPLNKYGIIQPRIEIHPPSTSQSYFTQIFAGVAGLDPYHSAFSEVYQDFFHNALYSGKAIFSVDAFYNYLNNRFPDNLLLSHDLLEGLYLKTSLLSDVEFIEDFPASFDSSSRRTHRWIRGDWQIFFWLLPYIPEKSGHWVKNTLNLEDKWKIFDNLRRSLLIPASLLLLLQGEILLAIVCYLSEPIILFVSQLLSKLPGESWSNYFKILSHDLSIFFLRCFILLSTLSYEAFRNINAIVLSLSRIFFHRPGILEWTSQAVSETNQNTSLKSSFNRLMPGVIIGLLVILLGSLPLIIGLIWILAPITIYFINKPLPNPTHPISTSDQQQLLNLAKEIWQFFDKYSNLDHNYLPVDNYQQDPGPTIARRTSPTNIGFMLLSTLAAHDLGLIDSDQVFHKLENTFNTLDKLGRYKGHFYNWYRTDTLSILSPAYISTVDSGNLAACLIIVAQACREFNWLNLAERADKFVADMQFEFLYDTDRKVFSIGFNCTDNILDASFYNLLASEARLTSLIAIGLKQIPVQHWFDLGRPLVKTTYGATLLSWGGTMFEYLMPNLFLKNFSQTLLWQTNHSIVAEQIKFAKQKHLPWGISESGYYSFDFQYNFQYQQFGIPNLSLKANNYDNLVVSPYSSLLALEYQPLETIKNLNLLNTLGAHGQYGFYEALDFTPEREKILGQPGIVKTYMAHHQGMSLVAITNYLRQDVFKSRFHDSNLGGAIELLLDERIPRHTPKIEKSVEELLPIPRGLAMQDLFISKVTGKTDVVRTAILSNSTYSVIVTNTGSGHSSWKNLDVTRWRRDTVENNWGFFCFIKDKTTNDLWSATYQPFLKQPDQYSASFQSHKAIFVRSDKKIETKSMVFVAADSDVEIREITISNHTHLTKKLELTGFTEIVGLPHADDIFHPAFGKLFIQSEYDSKKKILRFSRRNRNPNQKPLWLWHTLHDEFGKPFASEFETDRAKFIGRGNTLLTASAFENPLSNTSGVTLDPIASLRCNLTLRPGEVKKIVFITGIADSKATLEDQISKFSDLGETDRALKLAEIHSQIELKHLGINPDEIKTFQKLGSKILYPSRFSRGNMEEILKNTKNLTSLFPYGISGSLPIVLFKILSKDGVKIVRQTLLAHEYLRMKGINFDLIILSQQSATYSGDLKEAIQNVIDTSLSRPLINKSGGIFLLNNSHLSSGDLALFETVAKVVLDSQLGSLDDILNLSPLNEYKHKIYNLPKISIPRLIKPLISHFSDDGRQYQIIQEASQITPLPWSNVISNPHFGTLVTSSGLGHTWNENSQQNRLTFWFNDPVSEQPGEIIYFKDLESGKWWSSTPLPSTPGIKYQVTHGFGYTQYQSKVGNLDFTTTVWVDITDPVKIVQIKIKNNSQRLRKISSVYFADLVLGDTKEKNQFYIITQKDVPTSGLLAKNYFNEVYSHHLTFLLSDAHFDYFSGDRTEFLGRGGTWQRPVYLEDNSQTKLSGKIGANLNPAFITHTDIKIQSNAELTLTYLLGQANNLDQYQALAAKYSKVEAITKSYADVQTFWQNQNTIQISTPNKSLNTLTNGWLTYQTLSGRFWGRTGFFQAGGAFGFRDQLQDISSLLYSHPEIARSHILTAASHQFIQGDVMHWWHPNSNWGVRSRISDDFLWLPWAVSRYVTITGDTGILSEKIPYMDMSPLNDGENERYDQATVTQDIASLYSHCLKALENGMKVGNHGLPLIGSGDWNDGLNLVGCQGIGESTWLAWFQYLVFLNFSQICHQQKDIHSISRYQRYAKSILKDVEKNAWDGEWYIRAFTDSGQKLGSSQNSESLIDSISQTWAVISEGDLGPRAIQALNSVEKHLVDNEHQLIKLLTPPFQNSDPAPGYIQSYLPGIRENGGHYSHAAVWLPLAYLKLGLGDRAMELLDLINPISHTDTDKKINIYQAEPYVLPGDIYSHPQHLGRAGWSWYTGSAAWYYTIVIEHVFGVKQEAVKLSFNPCVPHAWTNFSLTYHWRQTTYIIKYLNPKQICRGVNQVSLDNLVLKNKIIKLQNDLQTHLVEILMG